MVPPSRRAARCETTAPAVTASCRCTADPGEFSGSHTTRSSMSVIVERQRDLAPVGARRSTGSPSADTDLGGGRRRRAAQRGRAVPARYGSPSCSRPESSSIRQPVSTASPVPGPRRLRGRRRSVRAAARRPTSRARRVLRRLSPRPAGRGRRRSRRRACAAPAGRASRCWPATASKAEPALPVDERAGLLDDGRDREHHVGAVGDRAVPQLEADDEGRGLDRGQCGVGVGQIGGVDARRSAARPVHRRPPRPGCRRCRGRRARGRSETCHAVAVCSRADASASGRPPGSRFGRRRPRARRDRLRAAAPSRAGRRSPRPACLPPRARRGRGEPLADENDRAGLVEQRLVGQRRRSAAASAPGVAAISLPRHLGQAAGGERRDGEHLQRRCLRAALRSRRKTIGRLLFRLEAGEQHRGRLLQVGVRDVIGWPGDLGGQELRLLVAVRPAAEVDVVGAQHHPGELRVRVGVLDGAPAADQHAGPARCGREPVAATPSASDHDAERSLPSSSRISGVVMRSPTSA